jgi:hypothetical protein
MINMIIYFDMHMKSNMSDKEDRGARYDQGSSGSNVDAYYSCEDCGQEFRSRQELEEHESSQH